MAAMSASLSLLLVLVCGIASSVAGAGQRKLLQTCPAATPNPCYNADGNAFTCCSGSCGSPPGPVAYCAGASAGGAGSSPLGEPLDAGFLNGINHVLIISVDGLHEQDVEYFLANNPNSTGFGWLAKHGTHYTNAFTTTPSDSFPGTTAILTGGGAYTAGFYYDDSYNRALSPPITLGGDYSCSTKGTEVLYDETIDIDDTQLNGGGGINPDALPRDGSKDCVPVYPNQYLRVNTIYEVAAQSGLYTAFADKHVGAYTIAKGPSGAGVSDYASLEIANTQPQYADANGVLDGLVATTACPFMTPSRSTRRRTGSTATTTPAPNSTERLQPSCTTTTSFALSHPLVVSVNQKIAGQGYVNGAPPPAGPVPTEYVKEAIAYADSSIGELIAQLEKNQILGKTVLIVTAKHGQSPIDPGLVKKLKPSVVSDAISAFFKDSSEPAQLTGDDSLLIWLKDASRGIAVRDYLNANKAQFLIDQCYHYSDFGETLNDYVPDLQCKSVKGTIYTGGSKISEHGGFADDDSHVPLFVANKYLTAKTETSTVALKQIAPTTLTLLGLDYTKLQAVGIEGTQLLPNTGLY